MKLIIQIPCYNEEKTLPLTLADLPKSIKGVDRIETQIVDDGSTDGTIETAKRLGVNHIVRFKHNKGLAMAFKAGVDNALAQGADILVNTDGDNQYCGADIAKLVEPIVNGTSDMVIGCRPIDTHPEFSFFKKKLQRLGSWVLRKVSNTTVEDASSGFRAYSREAMIHINVFSSFSYCLETIIQAGYDNLKITTCDIRINRRTRPSRLFRNLIQYLWKSGKTILNIFLLYRSTQLFSFLSLIFLLAGFALVARYLFLISFSSSVAGTFWPTIVLAGVLLAISFQMFLTGLLASLISSNRKLSEEVLLKLRKMESKSSREAVQPQRENP